jgi:hypothetical protein
MTIKPILLVCFVLGISLLLLLREFFRKSKALPVSYEAAVEAVKLMKDWGSWMTSVSTAIIGTNGFMMVNGGTNSLREPAWAYLSLLFFGLSIAFAAWVLGSLPSVVIRLRKGGPADIMEIPISPTLANPGSPVSTVSVANDIYEMKFFSFVPIRVGVVAGLQHLFFILGMYCFALYVTKVQWLETICLPWQ